MGACLVVAMMAGCAPVSPAPVPEPAVEPPAARQVEPAVAILDEAPPVAPVELLAVAAPPAPVTEVRPFTSLAADYDLAASQRVALARRAKLEVVKALFAEAGVAWPPAELALKAYKAEKELEVWASAERGAAMKPVATYGICATSGILGPKRAEGDGQVPEGFYRIQYLWPNSAFFLSMKVSYPNVSDRRLGHPTMPGSDIMIHGGCASIGCLAMSDERIQEIYVMAGSVMGRAPIDVMIFPTRDRAGLEELSAWKEHGAFWSNLYEGHDLFDDNGRVPRVTVDIRGRYEFDAG